MYTQKYKISNLKGEYNENKKRMYSNYFNPNPYHIKSKLYAILS